jgi:hypothetical protein
MALSMGQAAYPDLPQEGCSMLILGIKLKSGVDGHRLETFLNKWARELEQSTRIGSLTAMKLYRSAKTGVRVDEFVLTIVGFVEGPPLKELEALCSVVYSFQGEEAGSWPKGDKKH